MILKNFDKNKAVPNFASSLGWKLIGPSAYHDLAPPLSAPKINRPSRRIIDKKYTMDTELSINLFLVKSINMNATRDRKKNITCFPTIELKSNKPT